jgi:hypothetical protein
MNKKVRIHRDMTDEEKQLSVERIAELVSYVGGRKNLEHISGVSAQEISNVKQKKYISPQMAIRFETAMFDRDVKHFTRYYFCPDLSDIDFERVEESMNLTSAAA